MAETLESIKQEIAKIAAEKADLKGIVDQQKETIKRQETTIGNLQEALKAADANMVDRVNKLQKEIKNRDEYIQELEAAERDNVGVIAALTAKDEELNSVTQERDDLKEQVKSLEKALDRKGDDYYRVATEKEHLVNAIENAYRSLMITRGYQLPGEGGVDNG